MADNYQTNAGTGGNTFASDDVSSVHYSRIKQALGRDGQVSNDGCTIFRSIDLDETEEEVKATAGIVYGFAFTNTATATRFLKFYNDTAANVTVGATTPVLTLGLPGNTSDDVSGVFPFPSGLNFSTAITVAATTGVADNDTGAPAANDVIVNIFYV